MIDVDSGAAFSDCGNYRYRLWRRWADGPTAAFCLLNPSVANAVRSDPTVTRCLCRAQAWGFGELVLVNLFGWVSTDPGVLAAVADPIGPHNQAALEWAIARSDLFICGWGKGGNLANRGPGVLAWLRNQHPGRAYSLQLNTDGSPRHPLYVPYRREPVLL